MEVENLADDIITFIPEREPHLNGELKTVADILTDRDDCDVIIDFAKIDIVTSPSLAKLLRLHKSSRITSIASSYAISTGSRGCLPGYRP